MDHEYYEGLVWKIQNEDWSSPEVASKIRSLALWYEHHKCYTPKQRGFIQRLLTEGK